MKKLPFSMNHSRQAASQNLRGSRVDTKSDKQALLLCRIKCHRYGRNQATCDSRFAGR
jgi:hypothetical protein